MADDDSTTNSKRLRYSQVIEASLLAIGNVSQVEDDLNYAAQVMGRAVGSLKQYERSVDFHHLQEHDKMRAMLTLNTVYALQSKVLKTQADRDQEQRRAAVAMGGGGGGGATAAAAPAARGGVGSITDNNFNPFFPNRTYGANPMMGGGAVGGDMTTMLMDASRVSAASPGRSMMMNNGGGRY